MREFWQGYNVREINSGRHAHTIIVFQNQVISLHKSFCDSRLSASWERKNSKFGFLLVWLTYFHLWQFSLIKTIPKSSLFWTKASQLVEREKKNSNLQFTSLPYPWCQKVSQTIRKTKFKFFLSASWESWIWNRLIHRKDLILEYDHRSQMIRGKPN